MFRSGPLERSFVIVHYHRTYKSILTFMYQVFNLKRDRWYNFCNWNHLRNTWIDLTLTLYLLWNSSKAKVNCHFRFSGKRQSLRPTVYSMLTNVENILSYKFVQLKQVYASISCLLFQRVLKLCTETADHKGAQKQMGMPDQRWLSPEVF